MINRIPSNLLLLLFVVLYLLSLSARPLFIKDETRYAEVPREMIANSDWVVPRINGLRYFEKPVMGYWLTAVSLTIFGENNFAVRFPSALSTGLTALLIFFLCSHCFKSRRRLPWLAVLVYLTSLGVTAIGTFAVLDTPLTLFLTATMISFFLATEKPPGSFRERIFLAGAGVLAGCAFLTKGFLAFAVPVLVIVPYLLLQKRWRDILRMAWLPIIIAVLISLPWSILIQLREPDFWHYFFWVEHVHRFFSNNAQHAQPFWFFSAVLPAMFLPWILLLPASIVGAIHMEHLKGPQKRIIIFCLCWFLLPFFFFSASSGKLVTYILPCFPPLSILFAMGLNQWLENEKVEKNHLQWGIGALILIASTALLTLGGLHLFGPDRLHIFQRSWKLLLLSGTLAAMILLLVVAFRSTRAMQKIIFFGTSFALLLFAANFIIPSQTLAKKAPDPLLVRHAQSITPQTYILSSEEAIRAVCWYLQRDDVYLVERSGELHYGIEYKDSRYKMLNPAEASTFIQKHSGQTILIAEQEKYNRWQSFLPQPVSIDSSGRDGFVLIHY